MSFNGAVLQTQGYGLRPENVEVPVVIARAPTTADFKGANGVYPIGKTWVDTLDEAVYTLVALSYSGGVYSATWILGASSGAVDSFVTDSGTATPASGVLNILGTTHEISTAGSGSTVTLSVPTTFIAPGSIASTSTITAATGLVATTGGLTVTLGGATITAGGLTVSAGGAAVTGTTTINNSGSGVTTIGTGGTGAVNIGNATGNTAVTGSLTATAALEGSTVYASGDSGGIASTVALTNVNSTSVSSGTGTILMTTTNNANSSAWIKIYIGATAYYIPAFTTDAP